MVSEDGDGKARGEKVLDDSTNIDKGGVHWAPGCGTDSTEYRPGEGNRIALPLFGEGTT